jgi:hypothetical protein
MCQESEVIRFPKIGFIILKHVTHVAMQIQASTQCPVLPTLFKDFSARMGQNFGSWVKNPAP